MARLKALVYLTAGGMGRWYWRNALGHVAPSLLRAGTPPQMIIDQWTHTVVGGSELSLVLRLRNRKQSWAGLHKQPRPTSLNSLPTLVSNLCWAALEAVLVNRGPLELENPDQRAPPQEPNGKDRVPSTS